MSSTPITYTLKNSSSIHRGLKHTSNWTTITTPNTGWGNYDTTAGVTQTVSPDTWTTLACDGKGVQTDISYLPLNSTNVWDVATNSLDLTNVDVGRNIFIRLDFIVKPSLNNTRIQIRLNFAAFGGFVLTVGLAELAEGANIDYNRVVTLNFFLGSDPIRQNTITPEINVSSESEIRVNGFYITVV